jgi:hypothetical protein
VLHGTGRCIGLGVPRRTSGAGPVLDEQARRAYRSRLAELDAEIAQAQDWQDLARSERAAVERDALIRELIAAAGLGGRSRRLGDGTERARKTITTGTHCAYTPTEPAHWQLTAFGGLSGVIQAEKPR